MRHGGRRDNSGRKPKADKEKLITVMDLLCDPDIVLTKLYERVLEGDIQAIKLWLAYRYGMPKQTIETEIETEIIWQETKTYANEN